MLNVEFLPNGLKGASLIQHSTFNTQHSTLNIMNRILMMLAAAALALPLSAAQPAKKTVKVKKQNKKEVKASRKWDHEQVVELITKVNNYWQANNKPEVRAFWDNAAYHTGNMEVYKMLKDQKMLDYTIR